MQQFQTPRFFSSRPWLAVEFLLIFVGGPLFFLYLRRAGILFPTLWIGALITWWTTRKHQPVPHDIGREIRNILIRFIILAPLIAIAAWWLWPEFFLSLPRQRPGFWLLIMVLYPLLSVWPQEMLFRVFLFTRYDALLRSRPALIAASAASFGFAHVIFLNWIAVVMTTIGGFLFARDYARHRSLRLTCLEHSLYGCLIFTLGMGRFFYTGAAWHHH